MVTLACTIRHELFELLLKRIDAPLLLDQRITQLLDRYFLKCRLSFQPIDTFRVCH